MNLTETVRALRRILDTRTQRALVLATVASVLIALLDTLAIALVLPLVTLATGGQDATGIGRAFSNLLGSSDSNSLVRAMTLVVVGLFVGKNLATIGFTWWLNGFKVFKRVNLATEMLEKFLHAPYTEVSRRSSAELMRTMNDAVTQLFGTTVAGLMTLVSNIANLGAIALAILISAPLPSLFLAAYFGLGGAIYMIAVKPRLKVSSEIATESSMAAYRTAFAALGGMKEAKLRGTQDFFLDAYRAASLRGAHAARYAGFVAAAPRFLLEILFILAVGFVLLVGASSTPTDSEQGIGIIALFVAAGLRALPAVTSVISQLSSIRFGQSFLSVVLDEIERNSTHGHADPTDDVEPLRIQNSLRFVDVSFRYPGSDRCAVEHANFSLARGKSTAVVGGSGAGKTTLVDLILGLHSPTCGRIEVDGSDINPVLRSWQRGIGYVPQDVFLREASLAENVAFDKRPEDIDMELLAEVLRQSQLEELVQRLDTGVWTEIGERGSRLSGGQRQRIGIARALYREPSLLVLDEATSSLDNETEHRITEAVQTLRGELTIVIVAHRLSTVRNVDTVILMDSGRIEAIGSFSEVVRVSPKFARMVELGSLR